MTVDVKNMGATIIVYCLANHTHNPHGTKNMISMAVGYKYIVYVCYGDIVVFKNRKNTVSAAGKSKMLRYTELMLSISA